MKQNSNSIQGYIFRGTTLELFKKGMMISRDGNLVYHNSFLTQLESAIGWSFTHPKQSQNDIPCVICVDSKYANSNRGITETELVPISEIKVFRTDCQEGLEKLIGLVSSNPNEPLRKFVEGYGGWEKYKNEIIEYHKKNGRLLW